MSSIGFTGTELLKNIKKRTYTSKAELVRECGYQEVDYLGVEKINYSKFYDEFLKAFGVSIKINNQVIIYLIGIYQNLMN